MIFGDTAGGLNTYITTVMRDTGLEGVFHKRDSFIGLCFWELTNLFLTLVTNFYKFRSEFMVIISMNYGD